MRREEDSLKQIEALQKIVPFASSLPSDRTGWKGLQAAQYRDSPGSEFSLPPVSHHWLVLFLRPPEKFHVRYEGVKRDMPPPAGSITVRFIPPARIYRSSPSATQR